jgi:hypothetical protein
MGNTCGWSAVKPFFRSQGAVEESSFYIEMVNFKVKVVCQAEKYADGAGFSHGTVHVVRVVVKTGDLAVTSNDTAGLVFVYSTVFVDFDLEYKPSGNELSAVGNAFNFVDALIAEGLHFLADSFTPVICIVAGKSLSDCFWIAQKSNLFLGVRDEIWVLVGSGFKSFDKNTSEESVFDRAV